MEEPAECDESADGGRWSEEECCASDAPDELRLLLPIGRPSSSRSTRARCNCLVSSLIECAGGNSGRVISACGSRRVCAKFGMVAISGDSAQGFVDDVRSWSRVGSM